MTVGGCGTQEEEVQGAMMMPGQTCHGVCALSTVRSIPPVNHRGRSFMSINVSENQRAVDRFNFSSRLDSNSGGSPT